MNKKLLFHPMAAASAGATATAIPPAPTLAIVAPTAPAPETTARLDARLGDVMDTLDALHTAASEGRIADVVTASRRELIAWLYDVAFLVEETIEEVEAGKGQKTGGLHSNRTPLPRPTLVEAPAESRPMLTLVRRSS